jgi:hypothetical protein
MTMAIIDSLDIKAYHSSAPEWLSKTSISAFIKYGPKWWKLAYIERTLMRETPDGAMHGIALDTYLTEGAVAFSQRFVIKPDGMSFATKDGKAWKEQNASGKDVLSHEDGKILADAVDAVRRCCVWSDLEKALPQRTIRRRSESLGLGLQSRPDWLHESGAVLWDLKKTRDLDRFGSQAFDLGYHLQAAIAGWCLAGDGIALDHAYLVAVEWERGARCRVLEIPHEMLAHGDQQMREAAAEIARRIKADDWSDEQKAPQMLTVPAWAQRKMEAA